MERTPVKNEFAHKSIYLSTTDSGFCGSPLDFKDETPFSRHSFLKFTPVKITYNPTYDSNQNLIQIGKSDIIKQLSFEDADISNDLYKQQVQQTRFCGRKNSEREESDTSKLSRSPSYSFRVNFLARLKKINCEKIISDLLSYLPAEDLCRVSCVNKMWRELVLEDVKANGRRREYLKSIKSHRENRSRSGISPFDIKKRYERLSYLPRLVLDDISNCNLVPKVSTKCCNSKFDSFIREGKVGGSLMKCPSCKYPARRKDLEEYICTTCNYTFCGKCLSPCSKYHKCPKLEVPTLVIGSKQCKRNLKRL